ncbi:MAG: hypothetical protein PHG27_07540 [Massilibacteroides sp.]|nr:hypothetical protein [Massilibacteroides sp.]MDD4115430.1 hypothetical protein [Massilibacteroides sp.]MDD4660397.1 hypothetical protein [Massilibacteroides sp.]
MAASPYTLNDTESVSFVARRQTEHLFSAEAWMKFVTSKDSEEAGMTLLQNNTSSL